MSTPEQTPAPEPAPIARREALTVSAFEAENPVAMYLNTALFEQVQRVATLMSRASLVPAHLRGADKLSDCFLVVGQAFRWGMDPFAVAQHTYVLSGKLGYEGKLIAAVVNTSGRLARPLSYAYAGEKGTPARSVTVTGALRGEAEPRTIAGTVGEWKTANQQWATNADQMLAYRGAREWARRHMPEAVLGIQADEEIIDVTPAPAPASLEAPPANVADRMTEARAKLAELRPSANVLRQVVCVESAPTFTWTATTEPAAVPAPAPAVQNPDADDAPEAAEARQDRAAESIAAGAAEKLAAANPATPRPRRQAGTPTQAELIADNPTFRRMQERAARAAQGEK